MAMTDAELENILRDCGCGRDHTGGNTGECGVPALVAEVRRLQKVVNDYNMTACWHTCCPEDARRLEQMHAADERAEAAEQREAGLLDLARRAFAPEPPHIGCGVMRDDHTCERCDDLVQERACKLADIATAREALKSRAAIAALEGRPGDGDAQK